MRLSEQQHADLELWAKDGHRSLQKEIIWRLFSTDVIQSSAGFVTPQGREEARKVMTGKPGITDHLPQTATRGVSYDVQPDFKPERKR